MKDGDEAPQECRGEKGDPQRNQELGDKEEYGMFHQGRVADATVRGKDEKTDRQTDRPAPVEPPGGEEPLFSIGNGPNRGRGRDEAAGTGRKQGRNQAGDNAAHEPEHRVEPGDMNPFHGGPYVRVGDDLAECPYQGVGQQKTESDAEGRCNDGNHQRLSQEQQDNLFP